jgi:hypothetical protein
MGGTAMVNMRAIAPILADLLRDDPERAAAIGAWARATMPPGHLDQEEAAGRESRDMAAHVFGSRGGQVIPTTAQEVSDPVLVTALDLLVRWGVPGGGVRTCLHGPHPLHPEPVIAAAWKPDVIVCADCTLLLNLGLRPESDADRTCDLCGHICSRVEDGDGIWATALVIGALTFFYGVCSDCREVPA